MRQENKIIGQLKIQQNFLDWARKGIKKSEYRKKLLENGVYELIVLEHTNLGAGCEEGLCYDCQSSQEDNDYSNRFSGKYKVVYNEGCIKDRLKVRLTLKKRANAFKISWFLAQKMIFDNSMSEEENRCWDDITNFLYDWFKQGDTLYEYKMEVVE